ncbi:MAG: 1-deoxy-D-xylulose-5-phosphate reductoisomerase [Gemmataceae bacterium]
MLLPVDSAPARAPRRIAVLGSTGSIGQNTLDVLQQLPAELEAHTLIAGRQWQLLAQQCHAVQPAVAVIADPTVVFDPAAFPPKTIVRQGEDAVVAAVAAPEIDTVVAAVVGIAGLRGTWAAIEAGKTVALANKETLVVAGALVMPLARTCQSTILAVDSEHSAIAQALSGHTPADVARVVLTASGGPFRGRTTAELGAVTPEQALKHPTWQMGRKISIDSATLMNKSLEIIEARWLFDFDVQQLDVILHPESIVHSFVEFHDGSVLAQLSPPDMRLPIQLALLHPRRQPGPARKLNWAELRQLSFQPPDRETFPALNLGFEVARRGGSCGAVLNAANEAAVERFLNGTLPFLDIAHVCRIVLEHHDFDPSPDLPGLLALDQWARQEVRRWK